MCNYTDEVTTWRSVDRTPWQSTNGWCRGDSCVDNNCTSTVVLSVRHNTVGVHSVRHITGSTYERATHHVLNVRETSGREQRRERDVSMDNVVRDNYVKGLWICCDLNAMAAGSAYEINRVVDFMRRTRQLIAYLREVVIGLCHLYKCTPLNVLHWLHLLSIHTE